MKYIFPILLVLCLQARAQNRQLLYKLGNSNVTIMDSKVDADGNIVHVGAAGGFTAIFKTDANGNMLWSRMGGMQEDRTFVKVCIAANGDYIALARGSFGSLLRIGKDGNLKWYRYVGYSNTFNESLNSVAELPNGDIVLCGTNDFYYDGSNASQFFQGFLIFADAAGNFSHLRVYGRTSSNAWSRYDQYYFNDLVAAGNRIYIVGSYNEKGSPNSSHSLLLTTDLSGDLVSTQLMDDAFTIDNQAVNHFYFNTVGIRSGRLVLGGAGSINPPGQVVPFIAHTDTASGPVSLQCLMPGPVMLGAPKFAFRDTGDAYCVAMQPVPSSYEHSAYTTHLLNGTTRTRQYYQDSIYRINSITLNGTVQVVLSGFYSSAYSGYAAILNDTLPSSKLCGASDTVFDVYRLSASFTPPPEPPMMAYRGMTVVDMPFHESCIYEWYLCGDTVCREDFGAHLIVVNDTALCEGDTLRMSSADCYPKVWLRNGVLFDGGADAQLESAVSGRYSLAVNNGACFDTMAVQGTIYPQPAPHITQKGDSLVCDVEDARSYQWYDAEGNPVPGATGRYFEPPGMGSYTVAVTVGLDCTGWSEPYLDIDDHAAGRKVLQLFPNPSSGQLTVVNPVPGRQLLSFYRLDGRLAASVVLAQGSNSIATKELCLAGGTYIAVLVTPGGTFRQKLVVLP